MNKSCRDIALIGLLAILLVPGVSRAQIVEAATKSGKAAARIVKPGEMESLYALEHKLAAAVRQAALGPGISAIQYVPRASVTFPDLQSRRDIKQLQYLAKLANTDLSKITPLQIAQSALELRDFSQAERWVVFALNHGANPTEVLFSALDRTYSGRRFANMLINSYGINPNGKMDNGLPLLYEQMQQGPIEYALDLPDQDVNVLVNGEPLIFSTPKSMNSQNDFRAIFKRLENPWAVTNLIHANPMHMAAAHFVLPVAMPEGFKIPKEEINKQDDFGNTYLHYAVAGKYPQYNIKWLLEQGADPTIPNKRGETSLGMINQKITSFGNFLDVQGLGGLVDRTIVTRRLRRN